MFYHKYLKKKKNLGITKGCLHTGLKVLQIRRVHLLYNQTPFSLPCVCVFVSQKINK